MRLFVGKVLALALCTLAFQMLLAGNAEALVPQLGAMRRGLAGGRDIVYFGDSVLRYADKSDTDKRSIPEMLDGILGRPRVLPVQHQAYHLGIFEQFCRVIARSAHRPRFVVIPVNLRSFSPEWDLRPQYQFPEELYLLRWSDNRLMTGLCRPLFLLNVFDGVTHDRFMSAPVYDGSRRVGRVADFPFYGHILTGTLPADTVVAKASVLHYMGAVAPDHRKLRALREACRVLSEANVRPIVYVTPVDCDAGAKAVGERFRQRIADNVAAVRAALPSRDTVFLDLSADIEDGTFSYELIPNEHMKQAGRRYVAQQVAGAIRRLPGGAAG